jgi:pimeloyl-ACP methyl ester carboxylesterase
MIDPMKRRAMLKLPGLALGASVFPVGGHTMAVGAAAQSFELPWQHRGESLTLALHRQPAGGEVVLYVHGATFPSALAVGWKMHGVSWMDDLQQSGFDAWALDFAGYGDAQRPAVFAKDANAGPPFGRCDDAAEQIVAALQHIRTVRPGAPIHLIAHSWGTLPAQRAVIQHPEIVSRLVLFGPLVPRHGRQVSGPTDAWALMDEAAQRPRQRTGMPESLPTPVTDMELDRWCAAYLASDETASQRTPPSVRIPNGPSADVAASWGGQSLVDSAAIQIPVLIVRGEWDHVTTDDDARHLFDTLRNCRDKRDVKISGGNHWLHLQPRRVALWAEVRSFLSER